MNIASWLIATLFLTIPTLGDSNVPPSAYDKTSILYRLIQGAIFDIDSSLTEAGIKVHACRTNMEEAIASHPGIGACLYEAANYTFKTKKSATISLWVLNAQGQYLPPLKLEWKNTHTGWFTFGGEFLFMSFENFFGTMVKQTHNITAVPNQDSTSCRIAQLPSSDLGNFIGNLVITIPKGRKISEYFVFTKLDGTNAESISIQAKMPSYINKKRTYQMRGQILSDQMEVIEISLVTNYNLISRRDACLSGTAKFKDIRTLAVTP